MNLSMSISLLWLRRASIILVILMPILIGLSVLLVLFEGLGIREFGPVILDYGREPPITERLMIWWGAALPPLVLWIVALVYLFRLFRGFAYGRFLETETIAFARSFSAYASLAVVVSVGLSGIAYWATNDGHTLVNCLDISISGEQAILLLMAAVMFVMSAVLLEAEAYKREIEEYV